MRTMALSMKFSPEELEYFHNRTFENMCSFFRLELTEVSRGAHPRFVLTAGVRRKMILIGVLEGEKLGTHLSLEAQRILNVKQR